MSRTLTVVCDYCHRDAARVRGNAIYPYRADLRAKWFWRCNPCGAWVGCHPPAPGPRSRGDIPLGRLADAPLRKAKAAAHATFDPLYKSQTMTRQAAYAWLADAIGISRANCHIGMFDIDGCNAVIAAVAARRTECP